MRPVVTIWVGATMLSFFGASWMKSVTVRVVGSLAEARVIAAMPWADSGTRPEGTSGMSWSAPAEPLFGGSTGCGLEGSCASFDRMWSAASA